MQPIPFDPNTHYPIISTWWRAYNFPVMPLDHLPATGVVVVNALNEPVLAGFIYKTDCKFAQLEWIVANPAIKGLERDLAFDIFFESVVKYSKDLGISSLFTSLSNESLINRFLKVGAVKTDLNVTNVIWRL